MKKPLPKLKTDAEAEAFLRQDLSKLDFAAMTKVKFEFAPKTERVNMRIPKKLLDAVKNRAKKEGVPYQRFIRHMLEAAVTSRKP